MWLQQLVLVLVELVVGARNQNLHPFLPFLCQPRTRLTNKKVKNCKTNLAAELSDIVPNASMPSIRVHSGEINYSQINIFMVRG